MRTSLIVVLLALCSVPGLSQSLLVAPTESEGDQIRRLVGVAGNAPLTLTIKGLGRGDTDVIPLAAAAHRTHEHRVYDGRSPYFDAYEAHIVELSRGQWHLGYSWSRADLYQGNSDAAQVYLDSQSEDLTNVKTGSPRATMNRTSLVRWQTGYETPVAIAGRRVTIRVAANYLRMQRVQLGTLAGTTRDQQFSGVLSFLSTLDMPHGETASDGLGVDAGLSAELSERWRVSLQCENLASRIWQRGLQSIVADVATNTIKADEDGFLYGAPLVSGTTGRRNLRTELRRRIDLGAAYRQGRTDWLALLRRSHDWRLSMGAARDMGRGSRWWALLCPAPLEWQAGVDWGSLQVQLSLSSLDPSATERASVALAYRVCLEKRRCPGGR